MLFIPSGPNVVANMLGQMATKEKNNLMCNISQIHKKNLNN